MERHVKPQAVFYEEKYTRQQENERALFYVIARALDCWGWRDLCRNFIVKRRGGYACRGEQEHEMKKYFILQESRK